MFLLAITDDTLDQAFLSKRAWPYINGSSLLIA